MGEIDTNFNSYRQYPPNLNDLSMISFVQGGFYFLLYLVLILD